MERTATRLGAFWSALAVGMFLSAGLLFAAPAAAGSPKVEVCHIPPGDPANAHTIRVSENAIQSHLKHGDFLGPCDQPCEERCDDGNACTRDYCDDNNVCQNDEAVDCNDSNECTVDSCNTGTGQCENRPVAAGESCAWSDDLDCTLEQGTCDVLGECRPVNVQGCCDTDTECIDENLCTVEKCNLTTNTCESTGAVDCDSDACRVGICIEDTGACEYTPVVCVPSLCQTVVGCDPDDGCLFATDPNCCNPLDPNACNDGQNCTADVCDPETNQCSNPDCRPNLGECITVVTCNEDCSPFDTEQLFCDDGLFCTYDSCVGEPGAWACLNELSNCDDGDPCTTEACDPVTGDCFYEPLPDVVTGTDVGECQTQVEHCNNGVYEILQYEIGPTEEVCDGLDNDCDGFADETLWLQTFGTTVGECKYGVRTCEAGVWRIDYPGVGPVPEDCDGLDNDCDGVVDNGLGGLVERGSDVGECEHSISTCISGAWVIVDPGVGPTAEACDDLDHDCNGSAYPEIIPGEEFTLDFDGFYTVPNDILPDDQIPNPDSPPTLRRSSHLTGAVTEWSSLPRRTRTRKPASIAMRAIHVGPCASIGPH